MQMKLEVAGGVEELAVGGRGAQSQRAQQIHNGLRNIGELSNAATHTHRINAHLCPADCSTSVPDSERTGRTQQLDPPTSNAVAIAITTHILTY